MIKLLIILDLDGVLITTPPWKKTELSEDGYSAFNPSCVENLNSLLQLIETDIWLISSRRRTKSLEEFNIIFNSRQIITPITGFVPIYKDCSTRKEEVERFVKEIKYDKILIIDDDKTLNGLDKNLKDRLIHTELIKGFDDEKLDLAISML